MSEAKSQNYNKSIEKVYFKQTLLALIVRAQFKDDGINFFTPGEFSQQLGYMNRPAGYIIEPHVHKPNKRIIHNTQEVLFIRSGKLRIDFYSSQKLFLESRVLLKGDIILLSSGGHGFVMLEDSEIIEVKQGPYSGERDKEKFKREN